MSDENERDAESAESTEASTSGGVTDSIRKALFGGLSSIFMSEERLRDQLGELPRDALNYLAGQTEKTRQEFFSIVTKEFRAFLDTVDLKDELPRILQGISVEVDAKIRFTAANKPDIEISTAVVEAEEIPTMDSGEVPETPAPLESGETGDKK